MPSHFVFVRFFLGYSDPFPFERFTHLNDEEINGALEVLRKEWLAHPANAKTIEVSRRQQKRRLREWMRSCPAWPGRAAAVSSGLAKGAEVQPLPTGEPTMDEVAALAGWGAVQMRLGDSDHGITCRYPLARFSTKEYADAAAEALRGTVDELARSAYAKHHWSDDDPCYWHATANPRFVVVAEEKLSRAERARAYSRLQRLDEPAGEAVPPEEALLRFFLPKLRATLDQIRSGFVWRRVGSATRIPAR
jgi:hypothetical protein